MTVDPPEGWYVLFCEHCAMSLTWTREDILTRDEADLNWAAKQAEHSPDCPRLRPRTWEERTGGYEHTDEHGRRLRFQWSRFHGIMIEAVGDTGQGFAYLGDPSDLIAWLETRRQT